MATIVPAPARSTRPDAMPRGLRPDSFGWVLPALRLDQLDAEQREAVQTDAAPLCILAGPGSGKTRVLTHRIARRVEDGSADPRRVLALTFTRRAATELRTRLERLGIRDVGAVGTFHAVALAQLRQHRADTGRRPPTVLGQRRPVLEELLGGRGIPIGLAAREIDWACAQALTPDEYRNGPGRRRVGDGAAVAVAELQRSYEQYKQRRGLLDFDDLLDECTRLLRTDTSFREAQHWLFRHVFVDEFQDLNRTQFDLLAAWVGDRVDLCVVGDPDQAIYGWNGADASYLTEFRNAFPTAEVVRLGRNHRSTLPIIRAAEAALGRVPPAGPDDPRDTDDTVGVPLGPAPTVTEYPDADAEAVGIARHLRHARQPGTAWSNHAVLTRTNEQLNVIARALDELDVPYRIRGRGGVLRMPEVAEVVDQLVAAGPLIAAAAEDLVAELDGGPAARVALLAQQYATEDPRPDGPGFRNWLRTVRPGDLEGSDDAVDLVTFHAAKGLEWPHVVVAGLEDGFVPIRPDDPEEQRLLYVALSRAEITLHLTWARVRVIGGRRLDRVPSPWLDAIAAANVEPPPPPPERVGTMLLAARRAVHTARPAAEEERAARLRDWRDRTARARRISAQALLDDASITRVAAAAPTTLDALAQVVGTRPERLRHIGDEILAVVHPG
jgi:DNA helicase-2/ATP-dependent DNA helicase PcrA